VNTMTGVASGFAFELQSVDEQTGARAGRWTTPHGVVETPAFMPVGTLGTVKGLLPSQLRAVQVQMVLSNTYHLALRPGADVVEKMGGLHAFMNWDGPILTDSGGFQVFSLARLSRCDDEQVVFHSHVDGSRFALSPERAVRIQEQLGADCIMCLDECPASDVGAHELAEAVRRTTLWAQRCRASQTRGDQALFGIVQGGTDPVLRRESAAGLRDLDFPAYAIGGLSVGEAPQAMYQTLTETCPCLPTRQLRYLMGVGRPQDLLESVTRGIDLFDCVMPSRNGRNATAFTSGGKVKLRNRRHVCDPSPLDADCDCETCRHFSRAYLRHLFIAGEMLGPILVTLHNIAFYQRLMRDLRQAVLDARVSEFRSLRLAQWDASV